MVGRTDGTLIMKVLDSASAKKMSLRQLAWKSGIHRMTVAKYVKLIVQIQNAPRLKLEMVGLRVLVRKEK